MHVLVGVGCPTEAGPRGVGLDCAGCGPTEAELLRRPRQLVPRCGAGAEVRSWCRGAELAPRCGAGAKVRSWRRAAARHRATSFAKGLRSASTAVGRRRRPRAYPLCAAASSVPDVTRMRMALTDGCPLLTDRRAVAESFGPGRLMTVFLVAGAARAGVGGQAAVAARASRAWLVRRPVDMALNRLYTAAAKVHSAEALRLPRTDSWRKPMLCLMWPCGVSAMWPRWR